MFCFLHIVYNSTCSWWQLHLAQRYRGLRVKFALLFTMQTSVPEAEQLAQCVLCKRHRKISNPHVSSAESQNVNLLPVHHTQSICFPPLVLGFGSIYTPDICNKEILFFTYKSETCFNLIIVSWNKKWLGEIHQEHGFQLFYYTHGLYNKLSLKCCISQVCIELALRRHCFFS